MLQRAMHVFSSLIVVGLFWIQGAQAVSFERIDVASHMGEPFFAEVPLRLDDTESLAKTSVELGASSDYRILEVYRDQVINKIRVDIVKDERGPRVKLSSESPIDTAFFNLVLKVRYGRSTHYKKMPVFLEAASSSMLQTEGQPKIVAAPVNAATVNPETSDAFVTKVPLGAKTAFEEPVEDVAPVADSSFAAYGDWARTARYGPMVYGDTITIVAQRLRLDNTFTNQQVMVALFEKNKAKFGKSNINLIKAGSYLDVPTAEEVNKVSVAQAKQVIAEQSKAWKGMVKQPKYAAVADAQRKRYTRRVRVGEQASGVASAPIAKPTVENKKEGAEAVAPVNEKSNVREAAQTKLEAAKDALTQKDTALSEMQSKMDALKARLAKAEKQGGNAPVSVDAAALDSQNKRLEIVISRLKNQLEQAKTGASEEQGAADWLMYALAGLGVIILGLIGAVVMLLRREPKHPAEQEVPVETLDEAEDLEATVATVSDDNVAADEPNENALMNVDDFDMPMEESDAQTGSLDDMFEDSGPVDIPDFTDDETGEMEAFDADEDATPDPSVNYLEEADVYIRYGMEDEAEKQVKMALKLDGKDPAAHAKLIQVIRAQGNSSAEEVAITAAKAVLAGGALATFEGLLSSDSPVSDAKEESNISSLTDDFTGDDTGMVDFGEINFDEKPSESKDVMQPDHLDTGEMDFGEINLGDKKDKNAMEEESLDTGDLDFGELSADIDVSEALGNASPDDVMDADKLDTGDLDFGELSGDIEAPAEMNSDSVDDVMLDDSLDTGELDFGALNSEPETDESNSSVDFDFSEMAEADSNKEGVVFDENEVMEDSIDLASFGIDFDDEEAVNVEAVGLIDSDLELNKLDGLDMDSTSAISATDETMVVSSDDTMINLDDAVNDRDVDLAITEAEEAAKAASIELDDNAEDPFATASEELDKVEVDLISDDLADEDLEVLLGEDDDLLVLEDGPAGSRDISLIALDNAKEGLDDLDSISIDLADLDANSKSIEDDLNPEIEADFAGLSTIGDDLIDDSEGALGLDEFDMDDLDISDLGSANIEAEDSATDNFDATVILDKTNADNKVEQVADLNGLDDILSDETLVMDDDSNPMENEYTATGEMKKIEDNMESLQEDPMDSFEATTQLDGLMNDLKGLLDEDEDKK